jgi:hypothetical protein
MSDRAGPSYGDRLGALELRLAASFDIVSALDIRRQIVALIGEQAGDVELRRQARGLLRESNVVCGDLLISLAERGQRRRGGGDWRGSQAGVLKLADLGFRWHTQTSRWQARARALATPTFNRRLAEADSVAAIKSLIAEVVQESRKLKDRKQKDQHARMIAGARRMAAKRRGGMLLLAGVDQSRLSTGGTVARWKQLARLTEPEFMRAVEDASKAAMAYRPEPVPQIVMMRSGWVKDERGNACRRVYAAADGDGVPAHR